MTRSAASEEGQQPTGERFEPVAMHGQIMEAEHLARYVWASQFAAGKRVLDAACGAAYGTLMLAAAGADSVVGIDLDQAAVDAARALAPAGVSFDQGDLRELPYDDDEFDLIVCFEAIEHVPDPEKVLDELRRVLRPGGVVVLSTPNRDVYTPGNPFHLRELTPNELEAELEQRFASVALRRQHTWSASAVFDDEQFAAGENSLLADVELRKAYANQPGLETFTLAIAGDGELPSGHGVATLSAAADLREWSERLEAASQAVDGAVARARNTARAEVEMLRSEVAALRAQLLAAEVELARYVGIEARLEAVKPALHEHETIITSTSWRITRPLRALMARLRR